MLLSSWGDRIRIFPGMPEAWRETTFHNLRTQGARIHPALAGEVKATVPLKPLGDGVYELDLPKGGEAVLHSGSTPPTVSVAPVAADPGRCNYYGLPAAKAAH